MKKKKNQASSLVLRLTAPIVVLVTFTLLAFSFSSYNISERIYTYQIKQTLEGKVNLTRDVLFDGWKRTTGTALRTEDILREYVSNVFKGSINFLKFPEDSGLLLVDTQSEQVLLTLPEKLEKQPQKEQIRRMLKKRESEMHTLNIPQGGVMMGTYFPQIHIHIIGFNIANFANNPQQKTFAVVMVSIFLATALVITTLMFYLLRRHVITPLRSIQSLIADILKKDRFSKRLQPKGSVEMQKLGEQFNTLINHVEKRDKALKHHNKNLEDLVQERTKELEEAQGQLVLQERLAAIGEFASSVAHELRNPLASIKMGVEKIGENNLGNTDKRRLHLVNKEVIRLDSMLKGILAFAAPRPTALEEINLKTYLNENTPIFESLVKNARVNVEVQPPKRKLCVLADNDKLLQILINIVKNACEAAQERSRVTVSTKSQKKMVSIAVHNTGEPIPKETLERLFEPFYTTKKSGTGLGLPTTKRLLQEMGGDISIESTAKAGTTVTIQLSAF